MKTLMRYEQVVTIVKSALAVILATAIVSGCSQSVKEDDVATGLDYETDSTKIRTLTFDDVRARVSASCSSSRSKVT
jgi:outer membrane murein-binding lipoprotein Lpp